MKEGAIGDVQDVDPLERLDARDDSLECGASVGEHGHVPDLGRSFDADEVDRAEETSRFPIAARGGRTSPARLSSRTRRVALNDADG